MNDKMKNRRNSCKPYRHQSREHEMSNKFAVFFDTDIQIHRIDLNMNPNKIFSYSLSHLLHSLHVKWKNN